MSAESEMDQVEQMIATGQWDQANDKLAAVGAHVQTVKDADRKQGLLDHMNRLTAKVVSRNAHATALPSCSRSRVDAQRFWWLSSGDGLVSGVRGIRRFPRWPR